MDIDEQVKKARKMFEIYSFPGNLYAYITKDKEYIEKYKLVIFREDLDKLEGFIAYEGEYTYICVNHKRPIGRQNLTLAHELGHMFLHSGECFSDDKRTITQNEKKETEAFSFGQELLYPQKYFEEDFGYISNNCLLDHSNARDLGLFINQLCHKYYMSFPVILHRHLFAAYKIKEKTAYIKLINSALGMKYTELDPNFYIANNSTYDYVSVEPYLYLKNIVDEAIQEKQISEAMGEAIIFPYRDMEGM